MNNLHNQNCIFTAPAGWGKTRYAIRLAQIIGCSKVVDEWSPGQDTPRGALLLTNIDPKELHAWSRAQTARYFVADLGWRMTADQYLRAASFQFPAFEQPTSEPL